MKYGNMKRKNKEEMPMDEEIELDLGVEAEPAPESDPMEPPMSELSDISSDKIIEELKMRGILPKDFQADVEEGEMPPEEDMEEDAMLEVEM